jgi:hypothetical protein
MTPLWLHAASRGAARFLGQLRCVCPVPKAGSAASLRDSTVSPGLGCAVMSVVTQTGCLLCRRLVVGAFRRKVQGVRKVQGLTLNVRPAPPCAADPCDNLEVVPLLNRSIVPNCTATVRLPSAQPLQYCEGEKDVAHSAELVPDHRKRDHFPGYPSISNAKFPISNFQLAAPKHSLRGAGCNVF